MSILKQSTIHLYADDCIVFRKIKTILYRIDLEHNLDNLKKCPKWGMKFNPSKCQVMRIKQSRKPTENFYVTHYATNCSSKLIKQNVLE